VDLRQLAALRCLCIFSSARPAGSGPSARTLCSRLREPRRSVSGCAFAAITRRNGPVLSRVRAGRKQPQLSIAVILPGHANLVVCFSRFAACRMVRMQPVASAACGVGTASVCYRPLPPQCLRRWLCIAGRCSGPPAASADLYVVQQANPSSKSRGRLRVWRDHTEQFPQRFTSSVVTPPVSVFASRDFAGSGKVGRALSMARGESLGLRPACRLGRSQRGCGSDVQFLLSTRGAFNMAPHNRSLQRTASPPAELQR